MDDDDAWLALTIKVVDQFSCRFATENFAHETTLILGTLSLILHHSMNGALIESAKSLLLSTSISSIISDIIQEACSNGPALLDNADGTTSARNLMNFLLLQFFSFKSVHSALFYQDLHNQFLNGEHTASLNRLLQECRKMMYGENMAVHGEETRPRKAVAWEDDFSAITNHLIHLISCYSSGSGNDCSFKGPNSSKMLSEEIEKFCCDINSV